MGHPESLSKRVDTGEQGRFRCFSRAEIAVRGDGLDISWLKDENEIGNTDIGEPAILAREAMSERPLHWESFVKFLCNWGKRWTGDPQSRKRLDDTVTFADVTDGIFRGKSPSTSETALFLL